MDYIRFSVDGQRLDYDRKYYSSTDTIDTLYCNFKFETDDLGHIFGGWDLPYLWAQFHDEEGNVYIKPVNDNTCSIPHKCLRQLKFKMTLFATDAEDYMTCEKRYTTNEIAFKFKSRANIDYDGGVSPDDPVPTQWQILLDRVDECESTVDGLSQDVSAMQGTVDGLSRDVSSIGDRVDTLSQDVTTIDNKVDALDGRVTNNTNAIDGINTTVDELNTELDTESTARESTDTRLEELINTESTARKTADANLQSAINDRYTKAETDTLVNTESTARANADAELQSAIQAEATTRSEAIEGVNDAINELNTKLDNESTARTNADTNLQSLINDRYTKAETNALLDAESAAREAADTNLQSLITAESTARADADTNLQSLISAESAARENADADLRLLINDEVNERISGDNAIQQNIDNLDDRESSHYNDYTSKISNLDGRATTNENDIATLNALTESIKGAGAGFHSSVYRGKYLGDTYTDKQKQAIASGTFEDLFVGDYWTINGVNWRIADFDYYYNIGDTNFTKHHVVIVPDKSLYNAQMNSENITTGAYTGSEMYTTNLDNARVAFDNAFGSSFIPTHKGLYSNAVSGNNPSGWAWRDMRVELMSEEQVYGHSAWGVASHNGFDVGTQKTQFKLFTLDQTKISIRQYYWLTNICNSGSFAYVDGYGGASGSGASLSIGVRPFACLVGA